MMDQGVTTAVMMAATMAAMTEVTTEETTEAMAARPIDGISAAAVDSAAALSVLPD